ncbi:hypothetical protein QBC35DRAFT_478630 [Podospora australis]|uniref:Uncharacterized protein n=1 Tax=Podospora australis TaxID=1536484 RepID=A0AAN6WKB4_9PEZI|nr:hypothetical protein QBC35DRAFT_478630 [Podospora australis]
MHAFVPVPAVGHGRHGVEELAMSGYKLIVLRVALLMNSFSRHRPEGRFVVSTDFCEVEGEGLEQPGDNPKLAFTQQRRRRSHAPSPHYTIEAMTLFCMILNGYQASMDLGQDQTIFFCVAHPVGHSVARAAYYPYLLDDRTYKIPQDIDRRVIMVILDPLLLLEQADCENSKKERKKYAFRLRPRRRLGHTAPSAPRPIITIPSTPSQRSELDAQQQTNLRARFFLQGPMTFSPSSSSVGVPATQLGRLW